MGVKKLGDSRLIQDFAAPRLAIDVAEWHEYAVRRDDAVAVFTVDGAEVRTCRNPPTYPLQVMVAVFDFPGVVTRRGRRSGAGVRGRLDERGGLSPTGHMSLIDKAVLSLLGCCNP